jgi:NAD(P)-dependent dehydrogenase (short-subunit alcohol dehydrogenase family)
MSLMNLSYPNYHCISGKTVLITGADKGIGKEIARAFAFQKANLILTFANNESGAKLVQNECQRIGAEVEIIKLLNQSRVTVKDSIEACIKKYGRLDILINNGAISQEKPFLTITDNDWNHMMDINLRGAFFTIQEAIPEMIKQKWGRIINISSIGGQIGGINQIHYATAKAGLIGLTKSIAKTFSHNNITCNAISPGLIETDMIANELKTVSGQEKLKNIPRGCVGQTIDISSAILYLCSEQAHYITGQTLNINGGMYFG